MLLPGHGNTLSPDHHVLEVCGFCTCTSLLGERLPSQLQRFSPGRCITSEDVMASDDAIHAVSVSFHSQCLESRLGFLGSFMLRANRELMKKLKDDINLTCVEKVNGGSLKCFKLKGTL